MERLGDRLAELRQDRQLRQKDIADYLHVSSGTISNYECGNHLPDIVTLTKLAHYFNVPLDYLVGDIPSRIPLSYFAGNYVDNTSFSEILDQMSQLSNNNRRILASIISALALKDMVQTKNRQI